MQTESRAKALETFLKSQNSYQEGLPIVGSGNVFDVEGMMFYVLLEDEVEDVVRKVVSGFIKNVKQVELCPKKYLAIFDHQEYRVNDYLIYRMV